MAERACGGACIEPVSSDANLGESFARASESAVLICLPLPSALSYQETRSSVSRTPGSFFNAFACSL